MRDMSGLFLVQNWLPNDQFLPVLDICVQKLKHLLSVWSCSVWYINILLCFLFQWGLVYLVGMNWYFTKEIDSFCVFLCLLVSSFFSGEALHKAFVLGWRGGETAAFSVQDTRIHRGFTGMPCRTWTSHCPSSLVLWKHSHLKKPELPLTDLTEQHVVLWS